MKYAFAPTRFKVVTGVLLFLILAPKVKAQFVQQGSKLVGSFAVDSALQGGTVSISADGNTAIESGDGDNGSRGAAWVWTRSGGVWTQQGNKLVGTGAVGTADQGASVALDSDGNTAIVGGIGDSGGAGAAWIWTRSGGVWTQQGKKLVGTGAAKVNNGGANQGEAVALSADGNTAIVGGGQDSGIGAVWVWTRSGSVWSQQGKKLVGTGAVGSAEQGWSVSLSADGNTAIVGGPNDSSLKGAAWVWTRSGGVWTQQGDKLVGAGTIGNAQQGKSVSLSADGNTAIVGGPVDNNYAGAAWVWTRSGGVWTQQVNKLVGTGAVGGAAQQGASVALDSDGNTAIVGGPGVGAAWVWSRSGDVWTHQGSKLVGTGASGTSNQGEAVSLSADGSTAIVGAPFDNKFEGAVWIYTQNATSVIPHMFSIQPLNLVNEQTLRFALSEKARVVIQIFNTKGQMVSQLLDETRDAGNYTVPLPAELRGMYKYLDFRSGDFHKTIPVGP